ncbi:MAG: Pr6Pr family membrane protein [Bacteroidota bacterium]
MPHSNSASAKGFLIFTAAVAWFALLLQLYLMLALRPQTGLSAIEVLIRFLSFFTILSNLIVAVSLTVILLRPQSGLGRFFAKPSNMAAVALYILVVGIVYNIILRNLWAPQGMQRWADELLHVAVPVLYVVYYFVFVPRGHLKWTNTPGWLIYPFCYLVYSLVRGTIVKTYPYPFIDVNLIGYSSTMVNSGLLCAGFLVLGLLFVGIDKIWKSPVEK